MWSLDFSHEYTNFFKAATRQQLQLLLMTEQSFKAMIVRLIANGSTEEALEKLATKYGVDAPRLRVGLPKAHRVKNLGTYSRHDKTIRVANSQAINEPFVILHEFYHHLRTGSDSKHRGTERYADRFAQDFIEAYRLSTE